MNHGGDDQTSKDDEVDPAVDSKCNVMCIYMSDL